MEQGKIRSRHTILVIEDGDSAELAHAIGVAAKARGITEVAPKPPALPVDPCIEGAQAEEGQPAL